VKSAIPIFVAIVAIFISPAILAQTSNAATDVNDAAARVVDATESESATPAPGSTASTPESRMESVQTTMVLKVINADIARNTIRESATALGGYATHLNDSSITLKIPPAKMAEAMALFSKQGIVIQKTIERQDLTLEIAQLEGKLISQQEILAKLRGFFNKADFAATLDIERSMARLVAEIESVKGRLRYLKEQSRWSLLVIHFSFHERDRVLYVASPFEWLNGANLDTFLEEF
jgi:hypothetical protein